MNPRAIGYYVNPDNAYCLEHFDPETPVYDGWTVHAVIDLDSETDSPVHCTECETLIPERLTSEGVAYVTEALEMLTGRPEILRQWWSQYRDLINPDVAERAYRELHKVFADQNTGHFITWNESERFNVFDRTGQEVNTFGSSEPVEGWADAANHASEWWSDYGRENTEQTTLFDMGFPIHGPDGIY